MDKRKKYDQDFKRNAVLLYPEPGRTVTEVAENLGIAKEILYRWRREYHMANQKPCSNTTLLTESAHNYDLPNIETMIKKLD